MSAVMDLRTKTADCAKHGKFESRAIPLAGVTIWTKCPTCTAERDAVDARQRQTDEAQAAQRRLEERLDRAGIPRRFRDRSFDNFEVASDPQRVALAKAKDLAHRFPFHAEHGTTAVFSGRPGTGKNHLAMAIAHEVMAQGRTVMAVTVREMVMMLRAGWSGRDGPSELEVMRRLIGVDLLILDEVGVQSGSDTEHDQVFGVIDGRYREGKPILFLTNLPKAEFKDCLGARAFDRLQEAWLWVPFTWDSHRGGNGD